MFKQNKVLKFFSLTFRKKTRFIFLQPLHNIIIYDVVVFKYLDVFLVLWKTGTEQYLSIFVVC